MTANIDRAADVVYRTLSGKYGDFGHHEDVAQALAHDGYLMPDLPEPYISKFDTSAVFAPDEDSEDGAYIDVKVDTGRHQRGRITIDLDPSSGSDNGFILVRSYVSPQWCREAAALLLAAADYSERNQE